jgi:hypothetical protein
MPEENEQKVEPKGEAAAQAAAAAVERWLNEVVVPVRMTIAAALPRASPEERAAILARALQFLPGPAASGASAPAPAAPAAAPVAGQAEAKEAPAAASGGMEPLRPDTGQNGDTAVSRALEALEWRPAKNGKGQWLLVAAPSGEPMGPFAEPPLREFLERVKAAPSESGLILGGYRYRLREGRFLHRWPLRR